MDERAHFTAAYEDLSRCYSDPTEYSMLQASALLRKLLVDKAPLIFRVNQPEMLGTPKLKLVFPFVAMIEWDILMHGTNIPRPDVEWLGDLSVAPFRPSMRRLNLSYDEFMKFPFVRVGASTYSARRVIQYVAHVVGGVHIGTPDAEQQPLRDAQDQMEQLLGFFNLPKREMVLDVLRAIVGATVRGVKPLVTAVVSASNSNT